MRGLRGRLRNALGRVGGCGGVWCIAIRVYNEVLQTTLWGPTKRAEVSCDVALRYLRLPFWEWTHSHIAHSVQGL
jgi:hypothetical protein